MREQSHRATRIAAPVIENEIPVCTEVMYALPDPAEPDQAVVANVPVLTDSINYGDIVRLGPADELGIRPVTEVVIASGHAHFLAAAAEGEAHELVAEIERRYPAYAIRIACASDSLISVSVHPDLDPERVARTVADWLEADPDLADEAPAVADPCRTEPGIVAWA